MQYQLILLIISIKASWIKSQKFSYSQKKVELNFIYSNKVGIRNGYVRVNTSVIPKPPDCEAFNLQINGITQNPFVVEQINCIKYGGSPTRCESNFSSKNLLFHYGTYQSQVIFKIDGNISLLRILLLNLSPLLSSQQNRHTLTCHITDNSITSYYGPIKSPNDPSLSATSLVGIVFLCSCVALVCVFTVFWFGTIYYRQYKQNRLEKKHRKALEKSTQQMLDRSPIIIYDMDNDNNEFIDKDPMCAICLETYKNEERIRKIVCGHYFHVACIDPWLLSHQSCPLCNRNVLINPIPSISSNLSIINNEQSIGPVTRIAV